MIQLTKALALELAFKGIRVNAIAPGWIVTDLNRDYLASEQGAAIKREIPAGRFGEARDLDGALLLLASDAGRFITGATIVVDGGQVVAVRVTESLSSFPRKRESRSSSRTGSPLARDERRMR